MANVTPQNKRLAILRWYSVTEKNGQPIIGSEVAAFRQRLEAMSDPELDALYQQIMQADPVQRRIYDPDGAEAFDRAEEGMAAAAESERIQQLTTPAGWEQAFQSPDVAYRQDTEEPGLPTPPRTLSVEEAGGHQPRSMPSYSPYDDSFRRHAGALANDPLFIALVAAATSAESAGGNGWNPGAVGDGGASIGLFQMHDRGAGRGYSRNQRMDPEFSSSVMVPQFVQVYQQVRAEQPNLPFPDLVAEVAGRVERPAGYNVQTGRLERGTAAWNNYVRAANNLRPQYSDRGAPTGNAAGAGPIAMDPTHGSRAGDYGYGGGGSGLLANASLPAAQPTTAWMPPIPQGGFNDPSQVMSYLADLWVSADAYAAQVGENDPLLRESIIQAAGSRSSNLLTFMSVAGQIGYQNANLRVQEIDNTNRLALGYAQLNQQGALGFAQLGLQSQQHADTMGLAYARFAKEAADSDRRYAFDVRRFEEYEKPQLGFRAEELAILKERLGLDWLTATEGTWAQQQDVALQADRNQIMREQMAQSGQQFETQQANEMQRAQMALRAGFAQEMQAGQQRAQQARAQAQQLRGQLAPWSVDPAKVPFVPGFQPGGPAELLAQRVGAQFTPMRTADVATQVYPEAGLNELMQSLMELARQHPGSPAYQGG